MKSNEFQLKFRVNYNLFFNENNETLSDLIVIITNYLLINLAEGSMQKGHSTFVTGSSVAAFMWCT